MNKKAVSIRRKAVNIGSEKLGEVFRQNLYMAEIYPQEESRTALEVFQVAEGTREYFCNTGRLWRDPVCKRLSFKGI